MNGLPPIVKERPPEGTRRVLLTVSYDGTAYAGWQWQDNALSVQQVLEEALARLTAAADPATALPRPLYLRAPDATPPSRLPGQPRPPLAS